MNLNETATSARHDNIEDMRRLKDHLVEWGMSEGEAKCLTLGLMFKYKQTTILFSDAPKPQSGPESCQSDVPAPAPAPAPLPPKSYIFDRDKGRLVTARDK